MLIQQFILQLVIVVTAVQAIPTATLRVSNAQVSATGNRQADDDVCPDYEVCSTRGHRYWQTLQANIALAQPVDRTDGPEKFERFYGIEFASFEDPIDQLRQDLIDHGINYNFLDGFAVFSKDPDTGIETEETAYQNMFQTDKGVIIAVENFRHADEQKQLPWSEVGSPFFLTILDANVQSLWRKHGQ